MVTIRFNGYLVDVPGTVIYRNRRYTLRSSEFSTSRGIALRYAETRRMQGRPTIVKKYTGVKYRGPGKGKKKSPVYVLYGRKK